MRGEGPSAEGALSEEERALARIVRSVNVREQSTQGMRRKLAAAGYNEQAIEAALSRATSLGLVDDKRYAESLVRSALAMGKGMRAVRAELEGLGIGIEEVEAYQQHQEEEGDDEVARALAFLQRRPPRSKDARQGAYRKLVGRGYSSDAAMSAARLWSES